MILHLIFKKQKILFIFPEVKLVSAYKNTSFRQAERITLRSPRASRKLSLSSKSLNKSGTSSPTASPKPTRKLRIVSAVSKAYFVLFSKYRSVKIEVIIV